MGFKMKSKFKFNFILISTLIIFFTFTPMIYFLSNNNKQQEYNNGNFLNFQNLKLSTGEVLYSENFNDGFAENWVFLGGSWTVVSNQFRVVGNDGERVRSYYNAQIFSEYTYEGDFNLISGSEMQIIFNIQDIFNGDDQGHYCQITLFYDDFGMDRKDTAILYSTEDGQMEHIRVPYDFNHNLWYHFTLISTRNTVNFYLGGILVISYSGVHFSSGYIGLKAMYGPTAYIDNIKVLSGQIIPFNQIIIIILATVIPIIVLVSIIAVIIIKRKAKSRKEGTLVETAETKLEGTDESTSKGEIEPEVIINKEIDTLESIKQEDEIDKLKKLEQLEVEKPVEVLDGDLEPKIITKEQEEDQITEKPIEMPIPELLKPEADKKKLEVSSVPKPLDLYPIPSDLKQKEPIEFITLKQEEITSLVEVKEKEQSEETDDSGSPQHLEEDVEDDQTSKEEEDKIREKKVIHFCTNCGKPLVNTWNICAYCGVKIRKELWKEKLEPEIEKLEIKKGEAISTIKSPETTEFKESIETTISSLRKDSQDLSRGEKSIERFAIKAPTIEDEIFTKEKIKQPKATKNVCPFCGYRNEMEKTHCYQCGYKLNK